MDSRLLWASHARYEEAREGCGGWLVWQQVIRIQNRIGYIIIGTAHGILNSETWMAMMGSAVGCLQEDQQYFSVLAYKVWIPGKSCLEGLWEQHAKVPHICMFNQRFDRVYVHNWLGGDIQALGGMVNNFNEGFKLFAPTVVLMWEEW